MKQMVHRAVVFVCRKIGALVPKVPAPQVELAVPEPLPVLDYYRGLLGGMEETFKNIKIGAALQDLSTRLALPLMEMTAAKDICLCINGLMDDPAKDEKIKAMREHSSRGLRRAMLQFLMEEGDVSQEQINQRFPSQEELTEFYAWLDRSPHDEVKAVVQEDPSMHFAYQH